MKRLLFLSLIFVTSIGCNRDVSISDIEGVWSFYCKELGYAEVKIDSFIIDGINTMYGGMFPIDFRLEKDSIFILQTGARGQIQLFSDTLFHMKFDSTSYVYCRLDDSLRWLYGDDKWCIEDFLRYEDNMRKRAFSNLGEQAMQLWFEANPHLSKEPEEVLDTLEPLDLHLPDGFIIE